MRLDGEVTKDQYQEKRADLELQQAEILKRLDQLNSIIEQGEDDLEEALTVANQLPKLWAKADAEERRGILEAVFVRFVVGGKKVVDVEVRPPYSWLMRWTSPPSDAKTDQRRGPIHNCGLGLLLHYLLGGLLLGSPSLLAWSMTFANSSLLM